MCGYCNLMLSLACMLVIFPPTNKLVRTAKWTRVPRLAWYLGIVPLSWPYWHLELRALEIVHKGHRPVNTLWIWHAVGHRSWNSHSYWSLIMLWFGGNMCLCMHNAYVSTRLFFHMLWCDMHCTLCVDICLLLLTSFSELCLIGTTACDNMRCNLMIALRFPSSTESMSSVVKCSILGDLCLGQFQIMAYSCFDTTQLTVSTPCFHGMTHAHDF